MACEGVLEFGVGRGVGRGVGTNSWLSGRSLAHFRRVGRDETTV